MIHEISIENLGVIASARLTLGRGLTVVTGETGAGKTMVLTGLSLVTGGKTASGLVREGTDGTLAEAVVDIPEESEEGAALAGVGAMREDDGTVVLSRSVGTTASRSRTVVGGRQVPQALLANVSSAFVTVHGQSDQTRLRSPAKQRDMLDRYAGASHLETLARYREIWAQLMTEREELLRMQTGADVERQAIQHMRDDLEAIASVDPQPGESETLAGEARVLENVEQVRQAAHAARDTVAGDTDGTVVALLEAAKRVLTDAARHDETLAPLLARLEETVYQVADVGSELGAYLDSLDSDPVRLEQVQQRRSDIAQLERRLGRDFAGVLAFAEEAAARVADYDSWDERLDLRRGAVVALEAQVADLAADITRGRAAAATHLAAAVESELAHLAMADARFAVDVATGEPGPFGADEIAMMLAAHFGAMPRPVAEAASGGELSRIMLALEVSLAHGNVAPGHTFVFDEVDAGVGGKAAIDVGRRLADLARTQQVLVVTHLAQVAAFADHHIVVHKDTTGAVTTSQVTEVTGEDRVQEVARLLSGQEDSTTARAHALELIEGSRTSR